MKISAITLNGVIEDNTGGRLAAIACRVVSPPKNDQAISIVIKFDDQLPAFEISVYENSREWAPAITPWQTHGGDVAGLQVGDSFVLPINKKYHKLYMTMLGTDGATGLLCSAIYGS
jgi:hypothetical protein